VKPLAAIALVATLGAFAYRLAAPRDHDFAGALDQAERLVGEGRLAEAGSLLLGRIAPERMDATPEESLRFETVHQAWLDAVKAKREAKQTPPPAAVAAKPEPAPEPAPERISPPAPAVPDGEATLRLAEADAEAGRHEAARMRFESALSLGLSPESGRAARLGLAETHAALGEPAAARGLYAELTRTEGGLDPAFRERVAGSVLDRIDAALALGELEAALGYAEVAEPLVAVGSSAELSLAVRRASTRLALADRLVVEGDREAAKPLARAAAIEFLRADGLEVALGTPPEGFAAGTFARLASEALRIVSGERPASGTPPESLASFLRAETRRDAGLAASRALLAATPEAREGLIRARLEAYASALSDYEAIATASDPALAALAASREVECLVALNRVPEAIVRLERIASAGTGPFARAPSERARVLARHARDAAAVERLVAAGRAALAATPDGSLAGGPVPRSRADWQRTFAPTGIASVPDRP
jgi:tetratricopeptide (TPR) repeat protein